MFLFKRVSLFVCLFGSATSLFSENTDSIPSIRQTHKIREITVVSKSFREVIPSQKLSGKDLEQLNAHSVADALRYFSGVQLKDYGGIGGLKTVNVRSMGSNHVGVFYDGIQLGNAQNGVVDLGKYSLDDMEEISLYNGQKSDIFQPAKDYASAATIYMKTKRPQFADNKSTNLTVRYKTGSIQLINPSFRLEQRLNDKLSMSLSSEYTQSDGEYKFRYKKYQTNGQIAYDTTAIRQGADIKALRLEGGLYGRLKDGVWDAKLYYYDSDRGLPSAIVSNNFENGQRLWDKDFFVQSSFKKEITSKYKLQVNAKYAYDFTRYDDGGTTNYYQQEFYLSAVNMYNITRQWSVSLATDFQWNKLDANLYNFAYPQRYTTLVALASALNFGKFKAQASLLFTGVEDKTQASELAAPNKSEYTPSIFLSYKPFENYDFNLRSFYKRIFRMPTFNDLYYTTVGSANLRPEYTNQYDLGFTYHKAINCGMMDDFNLQADAYYIDQTDKIIASPTSSLFRWTMINMGRVKTRGVDVVVSLMGHIDQVKFNTNLTYTYQKAQDFTDSQNSTYKDQIPYTPWNSGSFILGMNYKTWNLNYSFIYTGDRYDGNINNISANYLPPWYTHDLSLQKLFRYKNTRIKTTIEVNNLLNQYYDVVLNYPMPGRNFKFIITVNL